MKRKRGNKKGKSKKQKSPNLATETVDDSPENDVESGNTDEISGSESESEPEPEKVKENENGKEKEKEKVEEEPKKPVPVMEVETPVEKKEQVVSIRPEGVFQRPPPTAVYGRVKLKLKATPKPSLDPPQVAASSEAQIQSPVVNVVDNKQDKEVAVVGDKSEDKIKKSPGIKIVVSSKSSSPQDGKENGGNGSGSGNGSGNVNGKSPEEKKIEEQEQKLPRRESKLNKQELEASLEVIKKIMKMDAAEPFNVPVNPVELGIPVKKKGNLDSWLSDTSQPFNKHADHYAVVKAILCAGLYPNVAATVEGIYAPALGNLRQSIKSISKGTPAWYDGKREVHIHPSSVNGDSKTFQYPFLVFLEKVETNRIFLRDTTIISPYSLLLFGGAINVQHQLGLVTVDGWLKVSAPAQTAVLFKELRLTLQSVLNELIRYPQRATTENEVLQSIIHLLLEETKSQA